jgi:hypothetical protein
MGINMRELRWEGVGVMWRGEGMRWKRDGGDNHIGGGDMGDRWQKARGGSGKET